MPFTDEDLKLWKKYMMDSWKWRTKQTEKTKAFLARLEAAEKVCSDMNQLLILGGIERDTMKFIICKKDLEAWRKAAEK